MTISNNTGKFVHLSRYLHIEAFHSLSTSEIEVVENAEKLVQVNRGKDYNVACISENKESISFLYYPGFFDQPFPQLNTSWRVKLSGTQRVRKRSRLMEWSPLVGIPSVHRITSLFNSGISAGSICCVLVPCNIQSAVSP